MLRYIAIVFVLLLQGCASLGLSSNTLVSSPSANNQIQFELVDGKPVYHVIHAGELVVNSSAMGFVFKGDNANFGAFELVDVTHSSEDETWEQLWGEQRFVRNHYNQMTIVLVEKSAPARQLVIDFRAFDDGVAFRYRYPQQGQTDLVIMDELTEFNFAHEGKAWWIPAYQDNRYEYLTQVSNVSELDKVHTPLTIEMENDVYVSVHEANLVDFASMVLEGKGDHALKADLVPWADGDRVKTDGDFVSPWRTLQIADQPGELIESNLIVNLNDPSVIEDTSWIEPHKYLGIWWGMHIGKYTFHYTPDHGATTENAIEHIDYAKQLGIDHLLIEGWNVGWEPNWFENAMHMFSFTQSTPDFDLQKVAAYAQEQGIKLIGYHETGSNIINYKKQIDDGMSLYESLGINDIKIGQVGSMLNMKEWHHGQFGVRYYREVLEKAAHYKLAVNFHEPIKDTGERRTYPHMMAREGARGQEYNAWSDGNPPSHTAILPFTRMLAGPMDFTPGIMDIEQKQGRNGRVVHTTAAKQLSMYVVFYSPIQMLADLPDNYVGHPAMPFLLDVPVNWEQSQVLNAAIGEYVTVVRQDRDSDDWYLGSLTNEQGRQLTVELSFLEPGARYEAQIYADKPGIAYDRQPTEVVVDKKVVEAGDLLDLNLAPGGGTAIRFKKL